MLRKESCMFSLNIERRLKNAVYKMEIRRKRGHGS